MATKKKRKVKKEQFGFKQGFVALVFILELILVFTFFDYIIHTISPDYAVPSYYFSNKIIYGTAIGFITYLFVRKRPVAAKSAIIAGATSILLQIRYAITGYPLSFVLLFLVIHFALLYVITYVGCKVAKM